MSPFLILAYLKRLSASEEKDLIGRIGRRDGDALALLYDLYGDTLYGFILAMVKKQAEAEDLLQELFVQIWDKARLFDAARGNVYTWLVTLARNRTIDHLRSKQFQLQGRMVLDEGIDESFHSSDENPLSAVEMRERAQTVQAALQNLPPDQRAVIQIAYFGGFSQTEIAARLNLPLGTVKTRMRQGMMKLRSELESGGRL